MADKAHSEFDKLLNSLLERKPPGTSASKIKELTKIAMSSPKDYKNIAHSVYKFIQRCGSEYKVGGLYVLDSISQGAAQRKKLADRWTGAEYLERFENLLDDIFDKVMQCPDQYKEKVKRVLEIWLDNGIYNQEVLLQIKQKHFTEKAMSTAPVDPSANGLFANNSVMGRDPRLRNTSTDQTNVTQQTLDSSALLKTLATITQGNLKIPDFLANSGNQITSLHPNDTNASNNNVATNPLPPSAPTPYSSMMPPSTAANSSFPLSHGLPQNQATNSQAHPRDPSQFDYGDMELEAPTGINHGLNGSAEAQAVNG